MQTEHPRLFVSHSVADEAALEPLVAYLRALGVPLFVCADSIKPGTDWSATLRAELEAADAVIWVLSQSALASTFCAYEVGFATALGKPVHRVSLDGTPPPPFAQHLQAQDVLRLRARRPWLDPLDALIEAFLGVL